MLCQQYWCDQWVKTEECNLNYIRHNQQKLKSSLYQGLVDAVAADAARDQGRFVVLPSTHIGSPRHCHQQYQDSMAVVRQYGKPDLFITFTCNPKWEEISKHLKQNQTAADRPDIVARVFQMKLQELLKDIVKGKIFGTVTAIMHVIEFQKRGLPHAHILLILESADKLNTTIVYDQVVSAQLPNPQMQPILFQRVTKHMLHGPCGLINPNCPCMENGSCTKDYPKSFNSETKDTHDSFPEYQRRSPEDNGISYNVYKNNMLYHTVDNTWVVPYNAFLLLKFDAHINVEICSSIQAVKYLYKYVYKGHDKVMVNLRNEQEQTRVGLQHELQNEPRTIDEISAFQDARYVGAPEAIWRLLSFKMGDVDPSVVRLPVHLKNNQMITYEEGQEHMMIIPGVVKDTKLMAYFKRVLHEQEHPPSEEYLGFDNQGVLYPTANDITYQDFPKFYAWKEGPCAWSRRVKPHKSRVVGRIFNVIPKGLQMDTFYLRLLLTKVSGYAYIKKIDY